jgi:hypothetical protein
MMVDKLIENSYVKLTTLIAVISFLVIGTWKLSNIMWTTQSMIAENTAQTVRLTEVIRMERAIQSAYVKDVQVGFARWFKANFPEKPDASTFILPDPFSPRYHQ